MLTRKVFNEKLIKINKYSKNIFNFNKKYIYMIKMFLIKYKFILTE